MLSLHIYYNIRIIEIDIYRCLCAIRKTRHEGHVLYYKFIYFIVLVLLIK